MWDCMKEQPLAGFENLSEQWWDNPEDAGGFSHGKGSPSCYAPVYSHRGVALFFLAIPNEMGKQNSHLFRKKWEQCFKFKSRRSPDCFSLVNFRVA